MLNKASSPLNIKIVKALINSGKNFDDYDNYSASGLVSVVNDFISGANCRRKYLLDITLVVELGS